jgi:hypothetical protein
MYWKTVLEHVSHLNCLGCEVPYEHCKCVNTELHKYKRVWHYWKDSARISKKGDRNKVIVVPVLLFGTETCVCNKEEEEEGRMQIAELRFLRSVECLAFGLDKM